MIKGSSLIDYSNSSAIEYNNSVNNAFIEICSPLLKKLGLTTFIYIKLLDPNKRLYLSNDKKWIEFHVKHRLHEDNKHENAAIKLHENKRYAFWEGYEKDRVFNACHYHGMWNGFILYSGNEIFSFATKKDRERMTNLYLKNLNLIEHFTIYFKNKAREIINLDDNTAFIHSKSLSNTTANQNIGTEKEFLENTHVKRFYFNKSHYITYTEAKYLNLLSEGKTTKEAAKNLNVSHRTIQKSLENVKMRFGLFSKSEIITLFKNQNIEKYIFNYD